MWNSTVEPHGYSAVNKPPTWRPMMLDYMILGMLVLSKLSGYDIGRWIAERGKYFGIKAGLPQVYRRLAFLTEKGWVEFENDIRYGRPDAKLYTITRAGADHLIAWANTPFEPSPRPSDPDFSLRLIFAGQLDRRIAIDIVKAELRYREEHDQASAAIPEPAFSPQIDGIDTNWVRELHVLTHERGYYSVATHIAWLKLLLARLEGSTSPSASTD
jgi:DNA-binding PadR family transcriptional regulator